MASFRNVTVPLIPEAELALEAITDRGDISETDVINRALQLLDHTERKIEQGYQLAYVKKGDGDFFVELSPFS